MDKDMDREALKKELESFLEQYPETQFIDVFAPDINGVLRGKRIRESDFGKVFGGGSNYCGSTTILGVKGEISESVSYGARDGDPDIRSHAVAGSLAPVPWATLPTAQCLLELAEFDGTPYFLDPRNVLRNAMRPLKDAGLHPVIATELEFYLVVHDGGTFKPRMPEIPGSNLPQAGIQYAHPDDLEGIEPFLVDLDRFCAAQNIPAGAALSEYSPGQFEVNLQHVDSPELACDHAVLLKRAVKAAARRNGMAATFMAKPFQEFAGSGLHLHISLLDDDGNNVFAGKCADGDFSDTLRHAIGGLAEAMGESMAVLASNANSYRRYAPGFYAPATPNWGPNHRDLAMRIPVASQKNMRVEYRVAGADANPYLVVAAVLGAMHHGISRECDPGRMVQEHEEVEYKATLPLRWPLALDAWDAGAILPKYLGEEYHRVFAACRREEEDKFHAEVTNRDYEWFLRAV
jgi:glutamine synthetase